MKVKKILIQTTEEFLEMAKENMEKVFKGELVQLKNLKIFMEE